MKDPKFKLWYTGEQADIVVYVPLVHTDARGSFQETFNASETDFRRAPIRQISRSYSKPHVFRGMHYQEDMDKTMHVDNGAIGLFLVDIRPKAQHHIYSLHLSERNHLYVYAPWYYARGFLTYNNPSTVIYYQSDTVNTYAIAINYNSFPEIKQRLLELSNEWIISEKDQNAPMLNDLILDDINEIHRV